MRVFWRGLLVVFVCGSIMLLAAARICRVDVITRTLPHPIRSAVATLAIHENGVGPNAIDRALRLDPDNAAAWSRRCTAYLGKDAAERLRDCTQAVSLQASEANYRAKASALEENGDPCAAEASFRAALAQKNVFQRAYVMRDQARAALACGDVDGSLAALQSAEAVDARNAEAAGETSASSREGLATDRSYMAVVYEQLNQPQKAREMCSEANPGYGSCTCELTSTGLVCTPTPPSR